MTDKELLELSAKAAGYPFLYFYEQSNVALVEIDGKQTNWSPLTDDGDALRLAVKIGLQYRIIVIGDYEATRRAIVRAAAEVGKNMEKK